MFIGQSLTAWERVFSTCLGKPNKIKEISAGGADQLFEYICSQKLLKNNEFVGSYRTERGVTVGFREEESREFFETRLLTRFSRDTNTSNLGSGLSIHTRHTNAGRYNEELSQFCWTTIPSFPAVDEFDMTVRDIYSALHRVGIEVLVSVAHLLQIDPQFLLDLTDLQQIAALDDHAVQDEGYGDAADGRKAPVADSLRQYSYSSSLLRICKYAAERHEAADVAEEGLRGRRRPIAFGAHTDSSFITVALLASIPGLEIVDQHSNTWVCPEVRLALTMYIRIYVCMHMLYVYYECKMLMYVCMP